jgi:hypothetical protein
MQHLWAVTDNKGLVQMTRKRILIHILNYKKLVKEEPKKMSMPTIPPEPHRPDLGEVMIDLLESIALEEIALSHIMNAEAEKIQAFVGECLDFPTNPTNHEIVKFNKGVNRLLETIVMKEWLLLKKLENVIDICDFGHHCPKPPKVKCKCDHCCIPCLVCGVPKCQCRCKHSKKNKHDDC